MSSSEYASLISAAVRLGYTPDDLDCALGTISGPDGSDETPERWLQLRARFDSEVRERGDRLGGDGNQSSAC